MDEFDLIARYFAPMAAADGAEGLQDDVALLSPPADRPIIVTTDALVEGVHFLKTDPLDAVAKKLVRVNVSDVLAKGALPFAASLTLIWPQGRAISEIGTFAAGLKDDLAHWGVSLIGGDTTRTPGPLTLSMTLHGMCLSSGGPVRRRGAVVGDRVYITGEIGRGFLGLQAAQGQLRPEYAKNADALLAAYRIPTLPNLSVARVIADHAHASLDVSDGLMADAGHLAKCSGVRIRLNAANIPFPEGPEHFTEEMIEGLVTGGDDYQTLFCAPEGLDVHNRDNELKLTCIGEVLTGEGVELIGVDGAPLAFTTSGWSHF